MRDTQLYQQLLGVQSPWRVSGVKLDNEHESIEVRVILKAGAKLRCPVCGKKTRVKDRRERQWRHLDTCQYQTLIVAPLPRTECETCGVKTVSPPWAEKGSRFTLLFERFAIDVLQEMSVRGACGVLGISWDEASGIMERGVKRGLARRKWKQVKGLGIDEKAVRKGHNYATVVYDLDGSRVLWVGEDRRKETLDGFFKRMPEAVRQGIECLTMDMWKPYRASCREWIENADEKTVLDRFHLEKLLNEAMDQVRKEEHREMKEAGVELLGGSKWLWLYHRENLSEEREAHFQQLRRYDLKTVRAYAIKENFRRFWSYRYVGNARRFFKDWYFWATHSRLKPVIQAAKRLNRHLERILNYFRFRVTNATAEGINNKIQTIKKKAYGFRNIQRFINAIYFHCGGLDMYPL